MSICRFEISGNKVRPGKQGLVVHMQVKGGEGVPFRARDLEMQIPSLSENPADSDKGAKCQV